MKGGRGGAVGQTNPPPPFPEKTTPSNSPALLGLRLRRICSFETDFVKRKNEMESWFLKRGYPERLIDNVKSNHYYFNDKHNSRKSITLVVMYHPLLKSQSKIISKNLYLLYMDEELKRVFTPEPMVSFKSSRNMSSYLVRAKLYPTERLVGSFKCVSTVVFSLFGKLLLTSVTD